MVHNDNVVKEGFRDGFFHRGKENPNKFSSRAWEAWEVGRWFQQQGLGYFSVWRLSDGHFRAEDGTAVRIVYKGKRQHEVTRATDQP